MTAYGTASPGLSDPVLIRERLFLLGHDEEKHLRPWVHPPALAVGLAGAALLDLMIAAGRPAPATPSILDNDRGSHHVLRALGGLLPAMLRDVSDGIYDKTDAALRAKGYIVPDKSWRGTRYQLADRRPLVRIRGNVRSWISQPLPERYPGTRELRFPVGTDAVAALVWALKIPQALVLDVDRTSLDQAVRAMTHDSAQLQPLDTLFTVSRVAHAVRAAVTNLALAAF